jgi:hypothetical protein
MPLRWDIAKLTASSSAVDDAVWATEPNQRSNIAKQGVLVALCENRAPGKSDASVSLTAVSRLSNYYYSDVDDNTGYALSDAFDQAIGGVRYDKSLWQLALNTTSGAPAQSADEAAHGANGTSGDVLSMTAAAAHKGNLYIKHTGQGHAFLWHNNKLQELLNDQPDPAGSKVTQIKLAPQDRVVLCTQGIADNIDELQLTQILWSEHNPTRAVKAILDYASTAKPAGSAAVAVLSNNPIITLPNALFVVGGLVALAVILAVAALLTGRLALPAAISGLFINRTAQTTPVVQVTLIAQVIAQTPVATDTSAAANPTGTPLAPAGAPAGITNTVSQTQPTQVTQATGTPTLAATEVNTQVATAVKAQAATATTAPTNAQPTATIAPGSTSTQIPATETPANTATPLPNIHNTPTTSPFVAITATSDVNAAGAVSAIVTTMTAPAVTSTQVVSADMSAGKVVTAYVPMMSTTVSTTNDAAAITPTAVPTKVITEAITPIDIVTPTAELTKEMTVAITPTVMVTPTAEPTKEVLIVATSTVMITPTAELTRRVTVAITSTVMVTPTTEPTKEVTTGITTTVMVTPTTEPTNEVTSEVTPTVMVTPTSEPTNEVTSEVTSTVMVTPTSETTNEVTTVITATAVPTEMVTQEVLPTATAAPTAVPTEVVTPTVMPTSAVTAAIAPVITPTTTATEVVTQSVAPTAMVTPTEGPVTPITPTAEITPVTVTTATLTVTPTVTPAPVKPKKAPAKTTVKAVRQCTRCYYRVVVVRHTQVTYRCSYKYVYRWKYVRVHRHWVRVRTLQRVTSCVKISSRPLVQHSYRRTGLGLPYFNLD